MQEPVNFIFPIMDDESFEPTVDTTKETSSQGYELIDSAIDLEITCVESDVKDVEISMDNSKSRADIIHKRAHNVHHLVVMVPSKEPDENYSAPFQFDRLAPARISTSPTLRRLRKNTHRHFMPLQDFFDSAKFATHKEQSNLESSEGYLFETPPWSPKYTEHFSPHSCEIPIESSKVVNAFSEPQNQEEKANHDKNIDNLAPHSNPEGEENIPLSFEEDNAINSTRENPPDSNSVQSCTQMKELLQSRIFERRRSSVVLSLPGLEVFPGDLLVSEDYMYQSTWLPNTDAKKPKWPFSKKGSPRYKQKQISDLENCLSTIRIPEFTEYEFYNIKDKSWNEVISMQPLENKEVPANPNRRRQESVWELFTSECTYFLDHLLVLKMVFLNTLKYLQSNDHLLDVDAARLFANLEELSQESLNFATSLFITIESRELGSNKTSGPSLADLLTKYFKESLCLTHQIYCLNYTSAVIYLENIKQREDVAVYLKWCEQHEHCKRLHLSDLLVAPLHRLTRYPLLLKNIWKRSMDSNEKISIYSMKEKVESSIRDLEGNVKWLDKSQKFKQLQEVIVWPLLWERDKRFFVPEGFKHLFKETNVENMLSHPGRHLIHEGKLILTESIRLVDAYLFLFDDFLLITKIKRNKRKSANLEMNLAYSSLHPELQSVIKDGGYCKVLDQPIPLDRLGLRSIDQFHVTVSGMRHAFLIQHENRYQQCVAAFILQAHTESSKKTWISQIETAISSYAETYESKRISVGCQPAESTEI